MVTPFPAFMSYKKINILLGWLLFGIAATVYLLCCEPTVSFWDCGEYISTAYKLEVGHPPGAPLFQLLGRFFSFFSFGHVSKVAVLINSMSALASALTIAFLFWTITCLAKKIIIRSSSQELSKNQQIIIFGSGIVGALAYTFSDTFWFSAVEGEVYALSSLFTAITFWAILKWDECAEEKNSLRWIVLISYLIGLSIGIHLLNLLTIPALVFVYYFRKYKPSLKGIIATFFISVALLAVLLWGIMPYIVILSGEADKFFVNALSFPIGVGSIVYFSFLIGLIVLGIIVSHKKRKIVLNTTLLCFTFLLIGYSSFLMLVIRSNANTPINENRPDDAFGLSSYLAREQYGETPLAYGLYYNAPALSYKDGKPSYAKRYDVVSEGKPVASFFDRYEAELFILQSNDKSLTIKPLYAVAFDGKGSELVYLKEFYTFFPRMWNHDATYRSNYEIWGNIKGKPVEYNGYTFMKPTFTENLRFFVSYQLGHLYFRYLMWNFSGKFNDIQGRGDLQNGEWITGFPILDKHLVDSYKDIPDDLGKKGHNVYYMLPLLLGLIGFFYQLNKDPKNSIVVTLLFFFTGIAIVIYANQPAYQPRERDYAYAASFYAFAIWIGLGTLFLSEKALKLAKKKAAAIVAPLLCLSVPVLMAKENWDDHDRSGRTVALEMAVNCLESCAPNAVLFTNADNDTFPLWYAQEVEGIRTDVRVINLSLLNADWYIDACKRQMYDSKPVPFTLSKNKYICENREAILIRKAKDTINIKDVIDFINDDENYVIVDEESGKKMYFSPGNKFELEVNIPRVMKDGYIPAQYKGNIQSKIIWELESDFISKSQLMQLDLLAHFNWERPVYFVDTWPDAYLGLEDYFQNEGLAYRLVPVETIGEEEGNNIGYVNTDLMYRNMMQKFRWKNPARKNIYLDETATRIASTTRDAFVRLSDALIQENKKDSAERVLDKAFEVFPNDYLPYNYASFLLAKDYLKIKRPEKSIPVFEMLLHQSYRKLNYYFNLEKKHQSYLRGDIYKTFMILNEILEASREYKLKSIQSNGVDLYFSLAPEYLNFCNRELISYFSMPDSGEYLNDIAKMMQSVSFVMQKANDYERRELSAHSQKIMKFAIQKYNQTLDLLEESK